MDVVWLCLIGLSVFAGVGSALAARRVWVGLLVFTVFTALWWIIYLMAMQGLRGLD